MQALWYKSIYVVVYCAHLGIYPGFLIICTMFGAQYSSIFTACEQN